MAPQLSPEEAVDQALALQSGPVVIADIWDNPGGGTAGDATILLAEVIDRGIENVAFGTIWDPIAVQFCHAAGEGAEIQLRFGAKSAPDTGNPIDKFVRVERVIKDAEIVFGKSMVPIGDSALISFDGIEVVLNTTRAQCFDSSLFDIMGINPKEKRILIVKSTNHFYASFSKIASEIIYCAAGSPYPNNPVETNYRKARRDIWPICENPFSVE
jgi:microcystin degradation protein MlrC